MLALRLRAGQCSIRNGRVSTRAISSSASRQVSNGNVLDTLEARSLLSQVTAPQSLRKHLQGQESRSIYVGVDPSADSLHVGNLLPLIAALHFLDHGHRVIVVVGAATGSIGDPSGRDTERKALSASELARNVKAITAQIHDFFGRAREYLYHRGKRATPHDGEDAMESNTSHRSPMQKVTKGDGLNDEQRPSDRVMGEITGTSQSKPLSGPKPFTESSLPVLDVSVVNNEEWYKGMNVLTFLRDVGKLARVGTMLSRDSVKSRLNPVDLSASSSAQAPSGLSFTEFSYQLLQAYDFSVLHGAPWHCTVQLGGSDQMGNIMAGVDLIRRQQLKSDRADEMDSDKTPAYGLTLPLLTTASGAKFGKSAGNAVWLSPAKCSDYALYQFFYRSRDDEVERYLKTLTLLPLETIEIIMKANQQDPASRQAQKILAGEVTELVRGKKAVLKAQSATRVLFEAQLEGLQAADILEAFEGDPRLCLMERSKCVGLELTKLAADVGLASSRGEAKRSLLNGGLYLNNIAVKDPKKMLEEADLVCDGQIVVLRLGRSEHRIIAVQ